MATGPPVFAFLVCVLLSMTLTEFGAGLVALTWAILALLAGARAGGCLGGLLAAGAAGFVGLVLGFLFYERLNMARPEPPPPGGWGNLRWGFRVASRLLVWGSLALILHVGPLMVVGLLLGRR